MSSRDNTIDRIDIRVCGTPRSVGLVGIEDDRLHFPRVADHPSIYCFTFRRSNGYVSCYIGETDRLRRRLQHYRTPGPTQRTNLRMNALMFDLLNDGGEVTVAIVESARAVIRSGEMALDLNVKASRVLVESAWMTMLAATGAPLENR